MCGEDFKEARESQGIKRKELAEKIGVAYNTIAGWETDNLRPSLEYLIKAADALDCTLDDYLGKRLKFKLMKKHSYLGIGGNMRFARELKNMSICDICTAAGINIVTLKLWESGKAKPRAEKVIDAADALGVSVNYYVLGKE